MHQAVLLNEIVAGLELKGQEGAVILDCTFGSGGHSRAILKEYPGARVIALDADAAVESDDARIELHHVNFRNLDKAIHDSVEAVIFDLGLSTDQLENSGRGFSFQRDEPLRMTFKQQPTEDDLTARDVVNGWSEESLEKIIRGYGQERFARKIARAIAAAREKKEIETSGELAAIIKEAVRTRGKIHPATKTFQALRIAVNDELGALAEGLGKGFAALSSGGMMGVISFHSLEDRIVKKFYRQKAKEDQAILITKKPITPTIEEIKNNPRSRSAKLRILIKK